MPFFVDPFDLPEYPREPGDVRLEQEEEERAADEEREWRERPVYAETEAE